MDKQKLAIALAVLGGVGFVVWRMNQQKAAISQQRAAVPGILPGLLTSSPAAAAAGGAAPAASSSGGGGGNIFSSIFSIFSPSASTPPIAASQPAPVTSPLLTQGSSPTPSSTIPYAQPSYASTLFNTPYQNTISPIMAPISSGGQDTSSSTYTVQAGDSLSALAMAWGVTLADVENANPQISDPNLISVGQVINVPAGATLAGMGWIAGMC